MIFTRIVIKNLHEILRKLLYVLFKTYKEFNFEILRLHDLKFQIATAQGSKNVL